MKIDVPEYFKMNPNLQLLLQASFIDDKRFKLQDMKDHPKDKLMNSSPKVNSKIFTTESN